MTTHAGSLRLPAAAPRFARFCAVGVTNTMITLVGFWLLDHAGLPYPAASACAFVVAVLNSYVLNGRWTFRARGSLVRYMAVQLTGLGLNVGLVTVAVVGLGIAHLLAQMVAIPPVSVVTFILASRFVFAGAAL